jgi:predicted nuclease of restriction endonuclease-like (RecB) superfamily
MNKKQQPNLAKCDTLPTNFSKLLGEVKLRIQSAQMRAVTAVNAELVRLYWDIGRLIDERQKAEGWGASVIPRLSAELRNELPEVKGFSERNIGRMISFFREYSEPMLILPQPAANLGVSKNLQRAAANLHSQKKVPTPSAQFEGSLLWSIPWFHHAVLMEKVKVLADRQWYMEQTIANGWSRNILTLMIDSRAHERAGRAVTNFEQMLPSPQSDLAQQALKDPYIFDFLTLTEPFQERELETGLLSHLEKFLLELGQGFAFVGRQYRIEVGEEDYYIDLLFYHFRLRSFVVIDLKKGRFKPEYAGKINFYCNVVNDQLRHQDDQPTIGLILCQSKDDVLAEYALTGIDKPIGVSSYELTRALPRDLQSVLPTIEQIETELNVVGKATRTNKKKSPAKVSSSNRTSNAKKALSKSAEKKKLTKKSPKKRDDD